MKLRVALITTVLSACALAATQAAAQSGVDDDAQAAAESERQVEKSIRKNIETRVVRRAQVPADVEFRMRDAEKRLAEAARQVADLSMRQLPRVERLERIIRSSNGPVLGITIGGNDEDDEPVEGVAVQGTSPGGPAEEAGIQAGDVIVSINDESLAAANAQAANEKLLDFMQGVEEGDELDIEFLHNGLEGSRVSTRLVPRAIGNHVFAFDFDGSGLAPTAPRFRSGSPGMMDFVWIAEDGGFGDMELVSLTDQLGSYFGTSEGLLVVRAPENEELKLVDGDVIISIDGRKPRSVAHAMRILASYQGGEELSLEIMRDKRRETVDIDVPTSDVDQFRGQLGPTR